MIMFSKIKYSIDYPMKKGYKIDKKKYGRHFKTKFKDQIQLLYLNTFITHSVVAAIFWA